MLPSGTYEDVANGSTSVADPEGPIKIYVQHPVQIAAPWDKKKVEARPLMLTKKVSHQYIFTIPGKLAQLKRIATFSSILTPRAWISQEAKKMRRQRRLADLKDKQDRIRMGLIPPDAPKGKASFSLVKMLESIRSLTRHIFLVHSLCCQSHACSG